MHPPEGNRPLKLMFKAVMPWGLKFNVYSHYQPEQ